MNSSSSALKVFISTGCYGCDVAKKLAEWVKTIAPHLAVEIIDLLEEPDAGEGVIVGVPTYVYDDQPVFLGNPSRDELLTWIENLHLEV